MTYLAAALWSVNDRLGGGEGDELPPPSEAWLGDLLLFAEEKLDEAEELADLLDPRNRY